MSKYTIHGQQPLQGTLTVSGSKNASLPILAATLLARGEYLLHDVPDLKDVNTMILLLQKLGLQVEKVGDHDYRIVNQGVSTTEAPEDLVRNMRASFLVMGPLLASQHQATVSLPGGCAIGARPIDLHLLGFEKLGAKVEIQSGFVRAQAEQLFGTEINLRFPTHTGTENLLMAAVLAKGQTTIANAAREPEVTDLGNFLLAMGAKITGLGTERLVIDGVDELHATEYTIIPDRVEAGTFIILAALVGKELVIKNVILEHLRSFVSALKDAGVEVTGDRDSVRVQVAALKPLHLETAPYPGFPTDLQAQLLVLLSRANGQSTVSETIFENRFQHIPELNRLGAKITLEHNRATVEGPVAFTGATVKATDLRAGASLVLAALAAGNTSTVEGVEHIERGYERLADRLRSVGASLTVAE